MSVLTMNFVSYDIIVKFSLTLYVLWYVVQYRVSTGVQ